VVRSFIPRKLTRGAGAKRPAKGRRRPSGKKPTASRSAAKKKSAKKSAKKKPKPKPAPAADKPASGGAGERRAPHTLVRAAAMLVAFAAMVGFAVVLSHLTLEPSQASVDLTHTNLRPGDSIRNYLRQPAFVDTVKQLGGNIVLGVPFGLLLPVLVPAARGLVRVTFVTAAVMLLVELVQGALITGRAFDIDDVILNAAGALLGYLLLGRRLGRAVHPPRRHWWQRRMREPNGTAG
jgi:hypothetical protein